MLRLFKKRNYEQEVANVLWSKLKDSKFRSEILTFLKNWIYTEPNKKLKKVLEDVYEPMNIQQTYLNAHKLCLKCKVEENERIAKKGFIFRLLHKLFPKVFLEAQIDLLDTIYVADGEVETFKNVLFTINQKMKEWKQYS